MQPRGSQKLWDEKWIRRALELAERGLSGASPNPLVGCVIARGGKLLGEGFHQKFGGPHAEVHALRSAGNARGATAYVNLEPCSHWGKTPPCAEALVKAGIGRVVCAMKDPNPLVSGKGFQILKRAGIRVQTGLLEREARDLNRSFLHFITSRKPYTILKIAMSLDGKTATGGGESQWITSKASREFSYRLRTRVDAILVGAETVREDDPALTSHGLGRNPARVVLSRSGKIPPHAQILDGTAPTWIFHGNRRVKESGLAEWIYLKPGSARATVNAILTELGRRGISRLLIEGGAETLGTFVDAGIADEAYIFIAPKLIGGQAAKCAVGGKGIQKLRDVLSFKKISVQTLGEDILIQARK